MFTNVSNDGPYGISETPNGASPQPDEVYVPASDGCGGLSGGVSGPCGVAGGVCRLRSRVAPGRLAVPVMSRVVR